MLRKAFLIVLLVVLGILFILTHIKWENHMTYYGKFIFGYNQNNRSYGPFSSGSKQNNGNSFINILEITNKTHNFDMSTLRILGKDLPIFIHSKPDYLSERISVTHIWEGEWLNQLLLFMKNNSKAQLIDLGCNLGVYTLTIAAFGRNVIAIDANINNTDRLVQSVVKNKFTNVKVILNAVSNVRKLYSMRIHEKNVGGQYLTETRVNSYFVKSILIDDLLSITKEKDDYVIKIDIQGSEIDSIIAASNFFSKRNVIAILMEWIMIKEDKDCILLIEFLMKIGYRPYPNFFSESQLLASNFMGWPYDIVWRKINRFYDKDKFL